jgi:hypothetical protein
MKIFSPNKDSYNPKRIFAKPEHTSWETLLLIAAIATVALWIFAILCVFAEFQMDMTNYPQTGISPRTAQRSVPKVVKNEDIEESNLFEGIPYIGFNPTSQSAVIQEIKNVADEKGYPHVDLLLSIAKCESTYDPLKWNTTTCPSCRGLYQWHKKSLPDDKCALDVTCSTEATITALEKNEQWRWPNCI